MGNVVITIARQYGSGGRTIGRMLQDALDIRYYDKDIIHMASEDSGILEELFGRVDEYSSAKKPLFGKNGIYTGELVSPGSKDFTSDENLFAYQAKIIRHLADTRSCVIIGRCANYVLKDYPNVLKVFISADMDFRLKQASAIQSMETRELERFLRKDDRRKEDYYRRYAGKSWTDVTQYDLCLDSGKLGFDRCVEIIKANLPFVGWEQ